MTTQRIVGSSGTDLSEGIVVSSAAVVKHLVVIQLGGCLGRQIGLFSSSLFVCLSKHSGTWRTADSATSSKIVNCAVGGLQSQGSG